MLLIQIYGSAIINVHKKHFKLDSFPKTHLPSTENHYYTIQKSVPHCVTPCVFWHFAVFSLVWKRLQIPQGELCDRVRTCSPGGKLSSPVGQTQQAEALPRRTMPQVEDGQLGRGRTLWCSAIKHSSATAVLTLPESPPLSFSLPFFFPFHPKPYQLADKYVHRCGNICSLNWSVFMHVAKKLQTQTECHDHWLSTLFVWNIPVIQGERVHLCLRFSKYVGGSWKDSTVENGCSVSSLF